MTKVLFLNMSDLKPTPRSRVAKSSQN